MHEDAGTGGGGLSCTGTCYMFPSGLLDLGPGLAKNQGSVRVMTRSVGRVRTFSNSHGSGRVRLG